MICVAQCLPCLAVIDMGPFSSSIIRQAFDRERSLRSCFSTLYVTQSLLIHWLACPWSCSCLCDIMHRRCSFACLNEGRVVPLFVEPQPVAMSTACPANVALPFISLTAITWSHTSLGIGIHMPGSITCRHNTLLSLIQVWDTGSIRPNARLSVSHMVPSM